MGLRVRIRGGVGRERGGGGGKSGKGEGGGLGNAILFYLSILFVPALTGTQRVIDCLKVLRKVSNNFIGLIFSRQYNIVFCP